MSEASRIDVSSYIADESNADVKFTHFCGGVEGSGCMTQVPTRGDYCEKCARANSHAIRFHLLKPARASLPDWQHALFGSPGYLAAVREPIASRAPLWRPDKTTTLTLLGDTGAGKTTAAVAICRHFLTLAETKPMPVEKFGFARGVRMVKARDIAGSAKRSRLGQGDAVEVATAMRATLLLLDELGFETRDDAIDRVLDHRYTKGLCTIVTSGLTMDGLANRYGEATRRRVTEFGPVVEAWR